LLHQKVVKSFTTTPTTAASPTTAFAKQSWSDGIPYRSVESTLTYRMAWRNGASVSYKITPERCSSTPARDGPASSTLKLWPCALRMANEALNSTPKMKKKPIPIELSQGPRPPLTQRLLPLWHALHNAMAAAEKLDKWSEPTRVGLSLVKSSQHARIVALALSLTTDLTSPQFHFKFDPTFQTMRKSFDSTSRFHRSGRLSAASRFTQASRGHQWSLQRELRQQPRHHLGCSPISGLPALPPP
jgi:hypothetical protein